MVTSDSAAIATAAVSRAISALRAGNNAPMTDWLRAHLTGHVMPFWSRLGLDEQGGVCTCVADDGRILSHDKWMWSQWRAVWVFSRLHRRHGFGPEWLARARRVQEFCAQWGWDDKKEGWALVLGRDGRILRGQESIATDSFAVYGLLEYHLATGDASVLPLAERTIAAALKKLQGPTADIPSFPYPNPPGAKPHGYPMFWSFILAEFVDLLGMERYRQPAEKFADEVFREFYRKDRDLLLEYVGIDGREYPPPQGTVVVPGHVIEDMWFQIHVARHLRLPAARIDEACRLILRHFDIGWDYTRGGGLLLAVDADGRETVGWNFADTKLWWPQTEALYAVLLGWAHTRQPVFLDWYERMWRVCIERFADWENGEWRQKLDRHFQPFANTVALPVKDPFHLPRSLMLQIELLQDLAASPTQRPN